jgi:hypothetical protein
MIRPFARTVATRQPLSLKQTTIMIGGGESTTYNLFRYRGPKTIMTEREPLPRYTSIEWALIQAEYDPPVICVIDHCEWLLDDAPRTSPLMVVHVLRFPEEDPTDRQGAIEVLI